MSLPDHIYLIAEFIPTFRGAPELLVPRAYDLTEEKAERYIEQIEDDRTALRMRVIKVPRVPPPLRVQITIIEPPPVEAQKDDDDECPF